MTPRFLFIQTHYPDFLAELYAKEPELRTLDFDTQRRRVLATGFGSSDAYSHHLRELGCETGDVIVNADIMQERWARRHGVSLPENVHDRRRRIVAAQIEEFRPQVLYVFEWCPLGDRFLSEIKTNVDLLVGQIASSLPEDRTFGPYDLMLSSCPSIVEHFRSQGRDAEYARLGFDERTLAHVESSAEDIDVSFVGGFAPVHGDRIRWLERAVSEFDVAIYGYGLENTRPDSIIRDVHRGPVWGLDMYRVLRRSKVTLNLHARIDVRGKVATTHANNMRLFEATGVGTCLLTEEKANLRDMFEPGHEVLTYASDDESMQKIRNALDHPSERRTIAEAGQRRTLREHTYAHRMEELLSIVQKRLRLRHGAARSTAVY